MVPNDPLLLEVLKTQKESVRDIYSHCSFLEQVPDHDLTPDEIAKAWADYELFETEKNKIYQEERSLADNSTKRTLMNSVGLQPIHRPTNIIPNSNAEMNNQQNPQTFNQNQSSLNQQHPQTSFYRPNIIRQQHPIHQQPLNHFPDQGQHPIQQNSQSFAQYPIHQQSSASYQIPVQQPFMQQAFIHQPSFHIPTNHIQQQNINYVNQQPIHQQYSRSTTSSIPAQSIRTPHQNLQSNSFKPQNITQHSYTSPSQLFMNTQYPSHSANSVPVNNQKIFNASLLRPHLAQQSFNQNNQNILNTEIKRQSNHTQFILKRCLINGSQTEAIIEKTKLALKEIKDKIYEKRSNLIVQLDLYELLNQQKILIQRKKTNLIKNQPCIKPMEIEILDIQLDLLTVI